MGELSSEVRDIQPQALAWRRDLHANPEIGFEEHRTASVVADTLARLGLDVTTGIGKTGVVGTLSRGSSGRSIALRADMDALPITENGTSAWRSTRPQVFHGCGHDGHTAALLSAAAVIGRRGRFDGTVRFIFQPAEEGLGGASAMLADGLFDRFPCDAIFGMHNWPGAPLGTLAARSGPFMAGSSQIDIEILGKGGHAGLPQHCADPIHAAAQLIMSLQGLVSRNADPTKPTVLSLTRLHSGAAYNVIPATAHLGGGMRYLDSEDLARIETRFDEIVQGVAHSTGTDIAARIVPKFPVLVNDAESTRRALEVGAKLVGPQSVYRDYGPLMGSDDFAWLLEHRPGCYVLLGSGDATHTHMPHDPLYDFNDALLPIATEYWVRLTETLLD